VDSGPDQCLDIALLERDAEKVERARPPNYNHRATGQGHAAEVDSQPIQFCHLCAFVYIGSVSGLGQRVSKSNRGARGRGAGQPGNALKSILVGSSPIAV
jgi:hypothetical protein